MNLLLDTHTILWALDEKQNKLSKRAQEYIHSDSNQKFVSMASAWELAIKLSSKKITFEGGADNFIHQIESNGFLLLPILRTHIARVESLPFFHRDPFDRLLVAAAMCEGSTIVTADNNIPAYGIPCIW